MFKAFIISICTFITSALSIVITGFGAGIKAIKLGFTALKNKNNDKNNEEK